MKRLLILFTNGFPYNISEPFLETEYPLYDEYFDHVLISAACIRGEKRTRLREDSHLEVLKDYTLSKDWRSILTALPYLLIDRTYYKEVFRLLGAGALTPRRFYEITVTAICGNHRACQVRKWLKKHSDYGQIVLYSYWMTIPAYAVLKLKKLLKKQGICVRTVSRCHGYDLYCERSKTGYLPFQKENIQQLDVVAPVSRNGENYLKSKYGNLQHIQHQYLGAADTMIENPKTARAPVKIVSCARVVPLKRLTRIVDGLALIEKISVHWTHIGGGEGLENLKFYAKEKLSEKQNIQVDFLGTVANVQVQELYKKMSFHVFLNVSETEGIPVAIMEAMNAGIPAIATDVGGTSELVRQEQNGYLLKKDFTDETLALLIERIANLSDASYETMCHDAKKTVQDKFNANTNYRHFIEEVLL